MIIKLYGDIEKGMAAQVAQQVAKCEDEELHVHIHSDGGDVYEGIAIYNALKGFPGKVITHVDGVAASMASAIAMAGDEIYMSSNAHMMIHNPNITFSGDADDLRNTVGLMESVTATLAKTYAARTRKPIEEIYALMKAETWMSADEAFDSDFCTCIEYEASTPIQLTPARIAAAARRAPQLAASALSPESATQLRKEIKTMANAIKRKPKAEDMPAELPVEAPAAPVTEVVPVDTSSDAYKAGMSAGKAGVVDVTDPNFVAGLAAGMGAAQAAPAEPTAEDGEEKLDEEGNPIAEGEMEEDEEEKPVAKLKIADIRAAFSSDPDFMWDALAMSEAGKSLVHIKAAYADRLAGKVTDLTAKLAKATKGTGPVATSGASSAHAAVNPNDPKAVAASEWDNDENARKGFSTKERYVAIRAAELSGKFRAAR